MTPPLPPPAMEVADEHLHQALVIFLLMEFVRRCERDFGPDDASGRRWFCSGDPDVHGGEHDLFAVLAPPWLIDGLVAYMQSYSEPNAEGVGTHATEAN
jgi:hypothetical protein